MNELPQFQQYTEMEEETICFSNHPIAIEQVSGCFVTSHKCMLIVLAKLELSTGIEWYSMLLKRPESDGWWPNLQILFIFFHHCDGLPFLSFWTLWPHFCFFCIDISYSRCNFRWAISTNKKSCPIKPMLKVHYWGPLKNRFWGRKLGVINPTDNFTP